MATTTEPRSGDPKRAAIEGQGDPIPRTPREIARARRRASLRRLWKTFRRSKMGMAGLIILVFFTAVALLAPWIADSDGLDPTKVTGPILAGQAGSTRSVPTTSAGPC